MKLIDVYDLRIPDTDGTKTLCQDANVCDRCGRQHSIVCVVEDGTGKVHRVGRTCCKRLFGWAPSESQVTGIQEGRKLAQWIKAKNWTGNLYTLITRAFGCGKGYTQSDREAIYKFVTGG